jgi:Ca2+-binding RTX toxin-like protein
MRVLVPGRKAQGRRIRMRCPSSFWLLLAVVLGGCSTTSSAASSSGGGDSAAVVTTPTIGPSAHAGTEYRIWGTDGDDVLVGTSGRDVIDGLRGTDIIRGRAGDDELRDHTGVGTSTRIDTTPDAFYGGPGDDEIYSTQHDRVYAGMGDDRVYADYVKRGHVIHCGPGRDVVVLNDDDPGLVLKGCERVRVEYAG